MGKEALSIGFLSDEICKESKLVLFPWQQQIRSCACAAYLALLGQGCQWRIVKTVHWSKSGTTYIKEGLDILFLGFHHAHYVTSCTMKVCVEQWLYISCISECNYTFP